MSEAERLADALDAEFVTGRISNHTGREAAAELRRLSKVEAQVEALKAKLAEQPARTLNPYRNAELYGCPPEPTYLKPAPVKTQEPYCTYPKCNCQEGWCNER